MVTVYEHKIFKENAVFIRAKLSSTRLPRKHLLPVQGVPIIERLIERVKRHTKIKTIVLCTTDEDEDDELVAIAEAHDLFYHRWKKGDVLRQYVDAAHKFDANNIINIDADDPLIDYTRIDETAAIMDATDADYVTWEGYPLGCTPSGMSARGLQWLANEHPEPIEHLFAYFEQEPALTKLSIKETSPILSKPYIKDIRLTLDYPEDYELFQRIYDNIYSNTTDINFSELMEYLDTHQDLIKINNFRNEEFRANQQAELKKSKKRSQDARGGTYLPDEQILEAHATIMKRGGYKTGYTGMDELFTQLRLKIHISTSDFKACMLKFYDRHNRKDFEFAVGSGSRAECKKYGFIAGGKLIFYMQKPPKE